jgi:hypothetical protein
VSKATETADYAQRSKNSTAPAIYEFIEKDLDSAEALLPATVNRNRANQYTAKSAESKAIPLPGKLDEGRSVCDSTHQ